MRLRLATVACAAALVALLAAPTPARAFNLFPSHWTRARRQHAEPFPRLASEPSSPGRAPTTAAPRPASVRRRRAAPLPVDRGAVHGPLGVGTAAAMRRAVDRAVSTARYRLKKLHFPGRGRDKEDKHASDASTTVSVSDILDDLERQLFLASPASAGVAHHESPLSALARAGHGVLDVFPSLGISGMFDTEPPKPLMRSAMDVRELDDAIEFVADVPGARDEDLQVEVLKKDPNAHRAFDVLVVRGERDSLVDDALEDEDEKKKKPPAGGTFRVRERHFGAFETGTRFRRAWTSTRSARRPRKGS